MGTCINTIKCCNRKHDLYLISKHIIQHLLYHLLTYVSYLVFLKWLAIH